jgi:hypothetical protein
MKRGLSNSEPRVFEKYLWVHERYVAVIDEFTAIPVGHPYVEESPDTVEKIRALPRFEKEAQRAREKVAEAKASNQ